MCLIAFDINVNRFRTGLFLMAKLMLGMCASNILQNTQCSAVVFFSSVRSSALNISPEGNVHALTTVCHHLQHVVIGKSPSKLAKELNTLGCRLVHA